MFHSHKRISCSVTAWFRSGHNCKLNRFSMLENFPVYLKSKGTEINTILTELNEIKHYKPQGRPTYSSSMIQYALLLRYTSAQSYKLLLDQLPLPSFSLLRKIQSGGFDAIKAIQLLLKKEIVSSDCVLLVDEMFLEKCVQYHGGKYVGEDEDGNIFKGIVVFMIVGLQKSIPYVVKSSPEIKITGPWLKKEIDSCIFMLQNAGFNVRAVIADDHSPNVSAFSYLHLDYNGNSALFIYIIQLIMVF